MKRIIMALSMLCFSALSACAVHTREGSITVDPDWGHHPQGYGGFCPPGQAKKGRC